MFFLLTGLILFMLSAAFPDITENIYSSLIYKLIGHSLSQVTNLFPFSLAEISIVLLVFFTFVYTFQFAILLIKTRDLEHVKNLLLKIVTAAGIIYFAFQLLWGINYNRVKLEETLKLDMTPPTQQELVSLCEHLIAEANNIREKLDENNDNIMNLPYEKAFALKIAYQGFEKASLYYPILDGKYGRPKGLFLSKLMCYTGITGFFFPFTGEANVNMQVPEPFLPFVIAHEMAHQIGFAREDEANFIAYIACINHPDVYFKYSGTLSALNYTMSALRNADKIKHDELFATCSNGVLRDIKYYNEFWNQYSGPVEKISDRINDTYLKTQNQKSGVKSYGAVVDLLIAEHRKNINKAR